MPVQKACKQFFDPQLSSVGVSVAMTTMFYGLKAELEAFEMK